MGIPGEERRPEKREVARGEGGKMSHYCPVCYKKIPEAAYSRRYQGCIEMQNLDRETGLATTGMGTIKLGVNPGEFESVYPKEDFIRVYDLIRDKQAMSDSPRIPRCP